MWKGNHQLMEYIIDGYSFEITVVSAVMCRFLTVLLNTFSIGSRLSSEV